MIRFKICCISSIAEASLAINYGASAIGLVSEMPSGPGVIGKERIKQIVAHVPPAVSTFLLTSKLSVNDIIEQQRYCRANTIQLVDVLIDGSYKMLKQSLPGVKIVRVVHVTGEQSISEALKVSQYCDGLLLDSGNPKKNVKELGGTGRIHNWDISQKIVENVQIPVFLAGGLNQDNITEAVKKVKPFAVDVCSGVRSNGKLDEMKLQHFVENLYNKI